MIYETVSLKDDIRQGDIFYNLPFVRFNLEELLVINEESYFEQTYWGKVSVDRIDILSNLEKTYAIILSQDCDCLRDVYISLIVINRWGKTYSSNKRWMMEIVKLNNQSPSKMYLPPDNNFKISTRMVIDFSQIFHLLRTNLEKLRSLRICRLNQEAMEHFREKVAYYFHRYGYTEYYPLNAKEMDKYEKWRKEKYSRKKYQTK
jgi:hypothetical protein